MIFDGNHSDSERHNLPVRAIANQDIVQESGPMLAGARPHQTGRRASKFCADLRSIALRLAARSSVKPAHAKICTPLAEINTLRGLERIQKRRSDYWHHKRHALAR